MSDTEPIRVPIILRRRRNCAFCGQRTNAEEINRDLLRELQHLVRLLEPLECDGWLNVPGLATLNGAREAIEKATAAADGGGETT